MFDASTYIARRDRLAADLGSGVVLLLGNSETPMNYADNQYPFRQDGSFRYFLGLDRPDLAALIDADARETVVYGDELTIDDIVWMGPQPTIAGSIQSVRSLPSKEMAHVRSIHLRRTT